MNKTPYCWGREGGFGHRMPQRWCCKGVGKGLCAKSAIVRWGGGGAITHCVYTHLLPLVCAVRHLILALSLFPLLCAPSLWRPFAVFPRTLHFQVNDSEHESDSDDAEGKDDILGVCTYDAGQLLLNKVREESLALKPEESRTSFVRRVSSSLFKADDRGILKLRLEVIKASEADALGNAAGAVGATAERSMAPVAAWERGRKVRVTVVEGLKLITTDPIGFSDPYCVLSLGQETFKTVIVKRSLNPKWEHPVTFTIADPDDRMLRVQVKDSDHDVRDDTDDILGEGTFEMEEVLVNRSREVTVHLKPEKGASIYKDKRRGQVKLRIQSVDDEADANADASLNAGASWNSAAGNAAAVETAAVSRTGAPAESAPAAAENAALAENAAAVECAALTGAGVAGDALQSLEKGLVVGSKVKVTVIGAEKVGMLGFTDPYCVIRLGQETYKTSVIKNTQNPQWDEAFEFTVVDPKDRNVSPPCTFCTFDHSASVGCVAACCSSSPSLPWLSG